MHKNALLRIWVIVVGICSASALQAAAYKCVDAGGNTVYRQTPCADNMREKQRFDNRRKKNKAVCAAAGEFAVDTAGKMRDGREAEAVFAEWGGVNAVPKATLNIINYVYSFKADPDTPAARIGSLVRARCSNNAFGAFNHTALPPEYDPDYEPEEPDDQSRPGGRDPAENPPAGENATGSNPRPHVPPTMNWSDGAADDQQEKRRCEQYRRELDTLDKKMRQGYDSGEGDRLRRERRRYRRLIREEC